MAIIISPVLTDASAAPRFGSDPSWDEILGRRAKAPGPILIPGVEGRSVLVTGAGGFIGSEMVRVFAASGARQIILLELAEQPLFAMDREMATRGYSGCCVPILGSVCDSAMLDALFEEYRPELVLHAAALKHVPLMERNPFAAVETNSLGTWRLAQAARAHCIRQMILVSTDKAVAPHSIMGASKRIAELAMLAHEEFTALRLVNVIGSPGSVAPLFAEQIAEGGPVTVTHPKARRFFFTLDEVAALLAQAISADAAQGLLAPDPGDPVMIADLAERMIEASGRDVRVAFTEPRPGDKLEEAVVAGHELCLERVSAGLRQIAGYAPAGLAGRMREVESAIVARDLSLLLRLVGELVPDYQPSAVVCEAARTRPTVSR
jgi:FlaA1/EpsC-like NDP-sugar epimerase